MARLKRTPKLGVAGTPLLHMEAKAEKSEEQRLSLGRWGRLGVEKRGLRIAGGDFANHTAPPAEMCYVSPRTTLSRSFGEESLGTQLTSSLSESDMADVGKNRCRRGSVSSGSGACPLGGGGQTTLKTGK